MNGDSRERAFSVLGDYLFVLETGARRAGKKTGGVDRTLGAKKRSSPAVPDFDDGSSAANEAMRWEKEKVVEWGAQGRMTADGRLRVDAAGLRAWTLAAVRRAWPELSQWDSLAVLIELDGTVPEAFMQREAGKNITEVVERIADLRIQKVLQTPEGRTAIAEEVNAQVSEIFGGLLEQLRRPAGAGLRRGSRVMTCSVCGKKGHTARGCSQAATGVAAAVSGGPVPALDKTEIGSKTA